MILWALVLTSCIPAFMAHGLYVEHSSGDQFVVKILLIIIIITKNILLFLNLINITIITSSTGSVCCHCYFEDLQSDCLQF